MENKSIAYLINCGIREITDSAELNQLYDVITAAFSEHQNCTWKAAVSASLVQKYEFFKRDGKANLREYLLARGYHKGTVSHMLRYGDFIVKMNFKENQIPAESVVRSILINKAKERWAELYLEACRKHRQSKPESVSYAFLANDGLKAANANDDGDGDDGDGDTDGSQKNAGKQALSAEPRNKVGGSEDTGDADLLDNIPTRQDICSVLNDFRSRNPECYYLPSFGESIPRSESFQKGALERFKEKLKTVSALCRLIRDYRKAGGKLLKTDLDAIDELCRNIHEGEKKHLDTVINADALADDCDEADDVAEEAENKD